MDTNTLQTLLILLAQKAASPPAQSVWQTGFGQLVPYIIAALAAVTVWLNSKAAASAKLALEETIKGNEAIKKVDEKVNGALEQMKAMAHASGVISGKAEERSKQVEVDRTVTAVREAIKEAAPAPAASVTVPAPMPMPGQIHKIEVVDSIKAVISPSKDS